MNSKHLKEVSINYHLDNNTELKKILASLLEAAQKGETGIILEVPDIPQEVENTLNHLGYTVFCGGHYWGKNDERSKKTSISF